MTTALLTLSIFMLTTPAMPCDGCKGEKDAKAHGDSCDQDKAAVKAAAPANPKAGEVLARGEKLKGSNKVELAALLAAPETHDGKTVALEAKVRKACTKKGCWMELASADKGPGLRVTFKDYGFFVPLDSAGATAKVEGVVKVAALSDDAAKHYESEGATVPRGKDGKAKEVQLVATGVELRR